MFALLQETTPGGFDVLGMINQMMAVAIPLAATWIWQNWLRALKVVNDLGPVLGAVAFIALTQVMTWLFGLVGVLLPGDISQITPDHFATGLTSLTGTILFGIGKRFGKKG